MDGWIIHLIFKIENVQVVVVVVVAVAEII
jgi:hypothetical protein